jgi:hypothetical protein
VKALILFTLLMQALGPLLGVAGGLFICRAMERRERAQWLRSMPAPRRQDPAEFQARADAFVKHLDAFARQLKG